MLSTIVISVVALVFLVGFLVNTRRLHNRTLERDAYRNLVHLQERPSTERRPDLRVVRLLGILLTPLWWLRDRMAEHPGRLASVTGGVAAASTVVALYSLLPDEQEQAVQSAPPSSVAPGRSGVAAPLPGERPSPRDPVERDVSAVNEARPMVEVPEQREATDAVPSTAGTRAPEAGESEPSVDESSGRDSSPSTETPSTDMPSGDRSPEQSEREPSDPISPELEQPSDPDECLRLPTEPVAEVALCLDAVLPDP